MHEGFHSAQHSTKRTNQGLLACACLPIYSVCSSAWSGALLSLQSTFRETMITLKIIALVIFLCPCPRLRCSLRVPSHVLIRSVVLGHPFHASNGNPRPQGNNYPQSLLMVTCSSMLASYHWLDKAAMKSQQEMLSPFLLQQGTTNRTKANMAVVMKFR